MIWERNACRYVSMHMVLEGIRLGEPDILIGFTLTEEDAKLLAEALLQLLSSKSSLESLEFPNSSLNDQAIRSLVATMQGCPLPVKQKLSFHISADISPHSIALLLSIVTETRSLCLEGNYYKLIDPQYLYVVVEYLQTTTCPLVGLNLSYCGLKDDGVKQLCAALISGGVLRTLNQLSLVGNQIADEGAKALAKVIEQTELETLELRTNDIADEGIISLTASIACSRKLNYLNLGSNKFLGAGVNAIARMLSHSKTLRSLHLGYSNLTDAMVLSILAALKQNNYLKKLDIGHNFHLTLQLIPLIVESVKSHRTLESIGIDGTQLLLQSLRIKEILHINRCSETSNLVLLAAVIMYPNIGIASHIKLLNIDILRGVASFLSCPHVF